MRNLQTTSSGLIGQAPLLRCLLIIAATAFVPCAMAATYYVAPTGNDGNSGSSSAPWANIQPFGNVAQAGDTVIVKAGTYPGAIFGWDPAGQGQYAVIAGTASKPIIIEADPNAAPGTVVIHSRNSKTAIALDLEPGCDYVNIIGFTVTSDGSVTKAGIKASGSTGNQILSNTVNGVAGIGGIFVDAVTNVLIKGNTCLNTQGTGTTGHGMYLAGSSTGVTITNNFIHDNQYVGLHVNGDLSSGPPGIVTNALIESNFIYNNGQNGINADGLQSSTIRNNLIYSYANYGIVLYQIDAGDSGKNNLIVNNTFASPQSGAGAAVRIINAGTGNTLFNNICLGGGGVTYRISSDSLPGMISDYNVASALYQSEDTGATETLAQWQASGQDAHSFVAASSALFVNAGASDYHLKSGSPAIDKGVATLNSKNAPNYDLDNTTRPQGAGYDSGAYEFLSAPIPPSITAQPQNQTVTAGQTATFSVSATGSGALTYQWRKNGTNIGGATTSSYTTPATVLADNGATFAVIVSNSAGSVTSNNAALTVNRAQTPPSITSPATATPSTAAVNTAISFAVSAGDADGDVLTYSWNFGDGSAAINGATASHTYASVGTFTATVTISDGHTTVTSSVSVTATSITDPSLVAYWKLDESTGAIAGDSSGHGNNGALINAPAWTLGKIDGALNFNGVRSYVSVPDSTALNPSQITLSAWINSRTPGSGTPQVILAKDDGAHVEYDLQVRSGKVRFLFNGTVLTGATTLAANSWNLIAGTYDGATLKIYVNGALDASVPLSAKISVNSLPVTLGSRSKARSPFVFNGILDDLRIYSRALTQTEIQGLPGSAVQAGAPLGLPVTVKKFQASTKSKAVLVSGVVPNTALQFNPIGQTVSVAVAGEMITFTLDKSGKCKNDNGTITLRFPRGNSSKSTSAPFRVTLKNMAAQEACGFIQDLLPVTTGNIKGARPGGQNIPTALVTLAISTPVGFCQTQTPAILRN